MAINAGSEAKPPAAFLRDKKDKILVVMRAMNLAKARRMVNGGSHGWDAFKDAFRRGWSLIPDEVKVRLAEGTYCGVCNERGPEETMS